MRKILLLFATLVALTVASDAYARTTIVTKGSRKAVAAQAGAFVDSSSFTLTDAAALTVADDDTSQTFSLLDFDWFGNTSHTTTSTRAWLVVTTDSAIDSMGIGYQVSMDGRSWAVGAAVGNATVKSTVTYSGASGWAAIPFATDTDAAATAANSTLFPYIRIIAQGDNSTDYIRCRYHLVYSDN